MMAEYYDLGTNLLTLVNTFDSRKKAMALKKSRKLDGTASSTAHQEFEQHFGPRGPLFVDPKTYSVRDTVCVTGVSLAAIQKVKGWLANLVAEPLPIESFHVKRPDDVKDGALLVPKVVLAASHCPGRKLISSTTDSGDSGQLDFLYDEIHRIGADIIVLYVDLPRCIYPPNKTTVYHQKAAQLLFKDQPILGDLAAKNCLFTVTDGSHLNHAQKKVIGDWITEPVHSDHRIYTTAAAEWDMIGRWFNSFGSRSIDGYVTETEVYSSQRRMRNWLTRNRSSNVDHDLDRGFVSANDVTSRQAAESGRSRSQLDDSDDDVDNDSAGWTSLRTRIKRKKKTASPSTYGSVSGLQVGFRRARQRGENAELRPLLEHDNNICPSYQAQERISVRTNNISSNGTSSNVTYL